MEGSTARDRGFIRGGFAVALVAFLPFARMVASGQSFYFRDLSAHFFPARRFLLEGLARGEWRAWNPFVHEGVPMSPSALGYPFDLLQLLVPNEFGISLSLALHIPLAAVSFLLLARELGLTPSAAATGAFAYALGGFSLSTINLYVYVQTLAWAPLFILAFRRAVENGTRRAMALAALALAITVSTIGIEIALQACLLAVVIAPPSNRPRFLRSAASAGLGVAMASAVTFPLLFAASASERGSGFPAWVVLSNSIHPMAFLQVLIAGLFGDVANLSGTWWGTNFFSNGFPYFLSLYLGPTVLSLAFAGATSSPRPLRRRLIACIVAGVAVGLGKYAHWDLFLNLSASLRSLRYPVKAFFMVHFAVALLSAFAISDIAEGNRPVLRRATRTALGLGAILMGSILVPVMLPSASFMAGFTPPGISPAQQQQIARLIASDAAGAGLVCLAAGLLGLMAVRERILPGRAAVALAGLVGADLLRCGAGLNASVTQDFYDLSPEMESQVRALREAGGRVFTCDPEASQSYWDGRHARGASHEAFSMAVLRESLDPDFNVPEGIRTALSIDRTGFSPSQRVLSPELATCGDFARIAPTLRAAGVNRVLSLDPLNEAGVRLLAAVSPERIAPVTIRIYELEGGTPRFSLPVTVLRDDSDRLTIETTAAGASTLTILDPYAPGWRATVNGIERTITRAADGHREVPLQPGRNEVSMFYEPPGLRMGLGISVLASLVGLALLRRGPRNPDERDGIALADPTPMSENQDS